MRLQISLWLLAVWLCSFCQPPGAACAAEGEANGAGRLYFATDRQQKKGEQLHFGSQLNEPVDHLVLGALDLHDGKPQASGRTFAGFAELVEELDLAYAAAGEGALVVFVHGCCVSFREAAKQAAELQAHVKAPVLFYDWGSPVAGYSGSLLAGPRSQERFNQLMLKIAHRFPRARIVLVGVSLGAATIDNFLVQYRPAEVGRRFDQVIFARADIDSVAFRTHLPRIREHARAVYVLAGKNDLAINTSHLMRTIASPVFRGNRLGRLTAEPAPDESVRIIDLSPLNMNHKLPCGVVADLLEGGGSLPEPGHYAYSELVDGRWQVKPR